MKFRLLGLNNLNSHFGSAENCNIGCFRAFASRGCFQAVKLQTMLSLNIVLDQSGHLQSAGNSCTLFQSVGDYVLSAVIFYGNIVGA